MTKNFCKQDFNDFVEWKKRKGLQVGIVTQQAICTAYPNANACESIRLYLAAGKKQAKNDYVLNDSHKVALKKLLISKK